MRGENLDLVRYIQARCNYKDERVTGTVTEQADTDSEEEIEDTLCTYLRTWNYYRRPCRVGFDVTSLEYWH